MANQFTISALRNGTVDHRSPPEAKIALFRALFRGREDVYPRRFESRRTGKTGYQPACANEWVRGVCDKPRIKCSDCPHQRFSLCHGRGHPMAPLGSGYGTSRVRMTRVRISLWASIPCSKTKPVLFWPLILTRKVGAKTQRRDPTNIVQSRKTSKGPAHEL